MGKILYIIYALTVVSIMSSYSYAPPSPRPGSGNPNSYYHGGSYSGGTSSSGGHK